MLYVGKRQAHLEPIRGNCGAQLARLVIERDQTLADIVHRHAVAILGYTHDGLVIQNSWGKSWGGFWPFEDVQLPGCALWSYADFEDNVMDLWVTRMGFPRERISRVSARTTLSLEQSSRRPPPRYTIRENLIHLDGADLMIFTSASPGRGISSDDKLESARWVEQINQAYASLFTTFVAHSNRVGFEDGLNFWGGATVCDPNGRLLVKGPYHEEALVQTEIDLNQLHRTRARLPVLRDERTTLVQREMARIVGNGERVNR